MSSATQKRKRFDAKSVKPFSFGADDGNRTRVFGLGSGHSAIELHLQDGVVNSFIL